MSGQALAVTGSVNNLSNALQTLAMPLSVTTLAASQTWSGGSGFDQLGLDGRLQLLFGPGFATAGATRLQLFDFHSACGALSADRIDVIGFDRARLDLSRLAVDGSLGVSAVPEPGTPLLWLAGGLLLAARARRRLSPAAARAAWPPRP